MQEPLDRAHAYPIALGDHARWGAGAVEVDHGLQLLGGEAITQPSGPGTAPLLSSAGRPRLPR
jgi:hypothetical protein